MPLRLFSLFLCLVLVIETRAQEFKNGVVVAVSAPGAEVGRDVLQRGGNAVDAAVATALAMAVTHPAAGNIGGGGFMVVAPTKGDPVVFDYREVAPAAAGKDFFPKNASIFGHRAVGVPGTVRGLALAHQKFGKLPWRDLVMPAVVLAKDGFLLDKHHAESLNKILKTAKEFAELQRVFTKPSGETWQAGDRLVQPDLAKTLKLIADDGPDAFYNGAIARQIVAEMKAGDGVITLDDLAKFQAKERTPIHGTYRGYDLYAPPPPSAGGMCLIGMLHTLEGFDLKKQPRFSPETLHLMIETSRRVYCDRARYLGDPAFTKIPMYLLDRRYTAQLARSIDPLKATPSETLAKDIPLTVEGDSTTHFSVADKDGMAVANTYTLEQSYGSRVVVRGAGFLLNDEMMDFNWRPGVTTKAGIIGTEANQIAPGKKMLSSQTPTIVRKNGKLVLVTGSPGGRTITNTVLNIVISVLEYDMPIQEAIDGPRYHHQWWPDEVKFEGTKSHAATTTALEKLGHRVTYAKQGDAHSIWVNPLTGGLVGARDKRLIGHVAGY